jgi:hypothetical protein
VTEEDIASRLRIVGERLDGVRHGLIAAAPSSLEACVGELHVAVEEMTWISELRPGARGKNEARAAAQQLRSQLQLIRRLLENAWQFHERWGKLLGAKAGGYLADGRAAPVPGAGRLFLRG